MVSLPEKAAQQSAQRTGGTQRRFQAFFCARTETCSRSFIHARPLAGNASRWAAGT
jgi:hypothetical protein